MELQIPSQINDVPNALIFCLLVIEILCNLLICSIHGFINIPHCAVEGNFLSGCKIGGVREEEELEVSHLLYADDTLLFCKDNPDQLVCLR